MDDGRIEKKEVMPASSGLSEAKPKPINIGELARTAEAHIAREEFIEGFSLLALAQEEAESDSRDLTSSEAVDLGCALAAAGHTFYNYLVNTDGHELPDSHYPIIGLEGQGRTKFHQAAEAFQYAIESDPNNARAYLGLSDMQRELSQHEDSEQTVAQLEAMLEEEPSEDSLEIRLVLAQHYRRQNDKKFVIKSYAKAIEHGVSVHPFRRHNTAREIATYLDGCDGIEPDEIQYILSACRRAIILDPSDKYYKALLSYAERMQASQKVAA